MQASELNKQREQERLANARSRAAAANYIGKPYSIAHGPVLIKRRIKYFPSLDGAHKRAMGE